jgi:hypothetical protein
VTASLEWLCDHVAVARVHQGHGRFGDPYGWCVAVVKDGECAVLKGALKGPTVGQAHAVEDALRGAGFKRVRFIDIDGDVHDKELT